MSSLPPTLETILPENTSPETWIEHSVGGTQHPWLDSRPFKGYTNAFIVRDGKVSQTDTIANFMRVLHDDTFKRGPESRLSQILLGMKKRGFGIGKINGFGGKVEPDESSRDAAIREMEEESGIRAPLEWAGTLLFFLEGVEKVFHCDVYRAETFEGDVVETDEMRPAWYSVDDIPYAQMWEDDPYWLPLLVAGTPFIGRADFDAKPGKEGEFVMRRWWVGKQA